MDFDPSDFSSEQIPGHELRADISESTEQLINALRIQRDADISSTLLQLRTENNELATPLFVRRNLDAYSSLEEVSIDATINRLTNLAEIILRFDSTGVNGAVMTVWAGSDSEPHASILIDNVELPCLEPPTTTELNRYLASLFAKNKTGDYSMFDTMDLGNTQIVERLIEGIQDVASDVIYDETYFLSSTLSPIADTIRFIEVNGEPQCAAVTIEHHAKASTIDIDYTKHTKVEPDGEDNPEFLMQQLDGFRTYTQNVDGESTHVPSTNDFLIVMRDFLRHQCDTVFIQPEESLGHSDIADPSLGINIEDQR